MVKIQENVLYSLKEVSKVYHSTSSRKSGKSGDVIALRGISLDIYQGEFLCITGRSGEGKSTLLNLLGTLDQVTSGTIMYQGKKLSEHGLVDFRRKHVGFIFQMFNLLPQRTALQNVMMGLTTIGTSRSVARKSSIKWLDRLGLKHRMQHKANELSGGEKQRVAIARAMVKEPEVLLADEPTGNLDKQSRESVLDIIHKINHEFNKTVIMVTHNLDDAQKYADRIIRIDGGELTLSPHKTAISQEQ